MVKQITINKFLELKDKIALIDVRTPAEHEHGHVPGAFNLPLFSNEERVKVGTTYKQVGREEAILLGFDLTGSKWSGFIKEALIIAPDKRIGVHCWRGGMRSGAMAWALDLYGFEVYVIQGGYKKYRGWVHQQFEHPYKLQILGGMTGSGKTRILQQLKKMREQVIDLEDLAQHQGSSYGSMNKMVQPTQEQFENNLAEQLKNTGPAIALKSMTTLNKLGEVFGQMADVKAMTDVTGFGLFGHLSEMCEGSGLSAVIEYDKVPVIPSLNGYLEQKCYPGGTGRNWNSYGHKIGPITKEQKYILADPQTSGGLLVAVAKEGVATFEATLKGLGHNLAPIGWLKNPDNDALITVI